MSFITYLTRYLHQSSNNNQMNNSHKMNRNNILSIKKRKEIGDYLLCSTIGRGASGRVKLGIHKQTGEKVAIKIISRSHLKTSNHTTQSVQQELAILQLLYHPHLVHLRQVLQDTHSVYFIMDYSEGGELFHVLTERGRLTESEARSLFSQLVSAIFWCHSHHIRKEKDFITLLYIFFSIIIIKKNKSHRDLKPENILLDKEKKNLKVADFGMATMQPPNRLLSTSCGSPHYASPEIVKGKKYDGKATDVWSCGVILYAMMTGHLPFDDEHMGRLLAKIKTGHYRPLPDYLSNDAKDIIQRMLVVNPTKRITIAEILYHPWLTNKSFLGTDFKMILQRQQQWMKDFNPYYQDPNLELPMLSHKSDLDGRIWETLKVLWGKKNEETLLTSLSIYGYNVQKLTCKLLQERSLRGLEQQPWITNNNNNSSTQRPFIITEDLIFLSSPLRVSEECYMLSTPYESSIDSAFDALLPLTPQSTCSLQQTPSFSLIQIDQYKKKHHGWDQNNKDTNSVIAPMIQQNRPSTTIQTSSFSNVGKTLIHIKSKAAPGFVMAQSIENNSCIDSIQTWWWWIIVPLNKKEPRFTNLTWWNKAQSYFFKRKPIERTTVTVECFAKNECEAAGKLHQVLEECYNGQLIGRMYPHGKVIWNGTMNRRGSSTFSFVCHIKKIKITTTTKIRIKFVLNQGDEIKSNIKDLLECLNRYESESYWLTKTNGWIK
ncbi:kinase-like domain-containing protein [Cokeromyces recurvatus]|uniref:kinase-like domain-containing protein n=1 Tax=Cokeromyces recurvatus TaxID=90255 RepID=UPI0022210518|nr:kinase-like domain-containing protein [Cokeromyces recurvatus]KAI7907208.1 kinase-like domain-containing protein [Cokeromyces recurvatus]